MIVRFIDIRGEKYEKLPEDIRALLSPQLVDIYRESSNYFWKAAKLTKYRPLKRLLEKLAADNSVSIVLLGTKEPRYEGWLSFRHPEDGCMTLLQPPEIDQSLPGDPPWCVREVYARLGALRTLDFSLSVYYGLLPHRSIRAIRWWLSEENLIPAETCFEIISRGDGDYVGYRDSQRGFWYNHEAGIIKDHYLESAVEDELTSYVERADAVGETKMRTCHFWAGYFPTADSFTGLFVRTYSEDDEMPISPFAATQGVTFYERDSIEYGYGNDTASLAELVANYSHSDQWGDEFANLVSTFGLQDVNAFLFISDFEIPDPQSFENAGGYLRYLGRLTYNI
jgi:hypothetical protein